MKCPECGNAKIVMDQIAELMCSKCGLVLSEGYYSGEKMLV